MPSIRELAQQHPKFAGLSPEAQTIVLDRIEKRFAGVSPEAQQIIMQRLGGMQSLVQAPMAATSIPPSPSADFNQFAPFLTGKSMPDVYGLVNSSEFKALPIEQKQALMNIVNRAAGQTRMAEATQGIGPIALSALGLATAGTGYGPGALVRLPMTRGLNLGLTRTRGLSQVPKAIREAQPVLAPIFTGATSAIAGTGRALAKSIKIGDAAIRNIIGGGVAAKIGRTLKLGGETDKGTEAMLKLLENEAVQRLIGYTLLSYRLGMGKNPFTGRGGGPPSPTGRIFNPTAEGLRTEISGGQ